MKFHSRRLAVAVLFTSALGVAAMTQACKSTEKTNEPKTMSAAPLEVAQISVKGGTPVENGRYLISVAGCNDCHTAGYLPTNGAVPESDWLCGDAIGWQGPWGTTYATNLRLYAQQFDEDTFVQTHKARQVRPPMPWASIHHMHEADLRSVYAYLKHLGPKGEKMPDYCPPGVEPKTPYFSFVPIMPKPATTQPSE